MPVADLFVVVGVDQKRDAMLCCDRQRLDPVGCPTADKKNPWKQIRATSNCVAIRQQNDSWEGWPPAIQPAKRAEREAHRD